MVLNILLGFVAGEQSRLSHKGVDMLYVIGLLLALFGLFKVRKYLLKDKDKQDVRDDIKSVRDKKEVVSLKKQLKKELEELAESENELN